MKLSWSIKEQNKLWAIFITKYSNLIWTLNKKKTPKKKKRTSVSNFQQFENFAFIFLQKSINLDELHLLISQLAFGKKKINLYFCHCWKQLFCNLYCVLISNRFLLKSAIFFSAEQMFLPHQKKKKYIILFVHSEYR